MNKFLLLTFCILFFTSSLFSQSGFKRNAIYLEAGGNGLFGGVNYERQLTKVPGLGFRFGLGFYTENAFYLALPVGINYLFPLKNTRSSFIEGGLGVTWARRDGRIFKRVPDSDHFTSFLPSIGFRKHSSKNLMWRINACTVINDSGGYPWIGFSLGKLF